MANVNLNVGSSKANAISDSKPKRKTEIKVFISDPRKTKVLLRRKVQKEKVAMFVARTGILLVIVGTARVQITKIQHVQLKWMMMRSSPL